MDASLDDLSARLTSLGLEVEKITNMGEQLAAFKVAHVISAEQHPDADRLRVCKVDTGDGIVQVVCGAPNARTGMKGVFAPSGTHIPGTGIDLKPTKIRGVESSGMLCSERELMLSDEHDGIIDLKTDAPAGTPYADLAGLDDPVIEIAITPNRQDCLGVAGIARDLAASGFGILKADEIKPIPGRYKNPVDIALKFSDNDRDACPLFVGRYIRGVKNGPSPKWLQDKLKAIGLRPISALVDITNFVTYDRGRPLHVFDAAKLSGTLHARLAEKGESLLALDGKTYQMKGEECVIADDNGVLGFGGVMGGEESGCTETTTDVLVEAALFDPIRTAMTGRVHGIESDARYRFERGVDVNFVIPGIELATKLIMDLCGGEPSEMTIAGEVPIFDKVINFDTGRVASLGGLTLKQSEIIAILERLGFTAKDQNGSTWHVSVPSWRTDIVGPADLVEEVLRIHGYDNIPVASLPRLNDVAKPTLTTAQRRSRATRRALASCGFNECVTWSFISEDQSNRFGGIEDALRLANPISSELVIMRPSLLPNLLDAARRNLDRSMDLIRLFEVGPQYRDDTPDGQSLVASGLRVGSAGPIHWNTPRRDVNAFDAKADAMTALAAAGAPTDNIRVFDGAPDWYHPGRSGTLRLNPKMVLANFGELHPAILKELDIDGPVVAFEVFMDNLPPSRKSSATKPAAKMNALQPVVRDFAFVVDADTAAADLMQAARGADKKHIKAVTLFDVFAGKGMEPETKSLAIAVRLEPVEATFTDDELDAIAKKIVAAVGKATGGTLRG